MRTLRIVFMGTPEFATATLVKLVERHYQVVGVVTAPDRPAGRGRKLQESDVKKYAIAKGLKVMQPTNLKDEKFLDDLKTLDANLHIVVAFRMLPKVVWAMPKFGTFNLHASLLPQYRGAAPINWAVINGETETGVTTFFIDEKIDTGEIILQKKMDIQQNDTAGTLHDKLMHAGADLVLQTVRQIESDSTIPLKQKDAANVKQAPKIYRETCKIDWSAPMDAVHNHIRGLSPYPTAWTTLVNDDTKIVIKVYAASKEKIAHRLKSGKVLCNKKMMKIAVKGGFIHLLEIQLPGKRKMKTQEVLNGLILGEKAHML